jgi:hypothetical protein
VNVNEVYNLIKYACNKNQQGDISPAKFNLIIGQAQRGYLDYLLGEYQRYQIQRPIAVVEFGQNERIRETMSQLIYNIDLFPSPTTGITPFPSDYEYTDAMTSLYNFYRIKFIQQDRMYSYIHSSIDPIVQNPVYIIRKEGFQFFPNDIGGAHLSYVRVPPPITWGYVSDPNGRPVYDPLNSQQPIWSDSDMMQIIVRALALVGVNLQLGAVMQYSEQIKNTGQ